MAFLRQFINGVTVNLHELNDSITIGRSAECQISVDDPTVSGTHAQIQKEGDQWRLTDLNSTNGVLVKGKKIDTLLLEPSTVFSLGTHEFEFSLDLPAHLDTTLKIKKSWIPGIYYTK